LSLLDVPDDIDDQYFSGSLLPELPKQQKDLSPLEALAAEVAYESATKINPE